MILLSILTVLSLHLTSIQAQGAAHYNGGSSGQYYYNDDSLGWFWFILFLIGLGLIICLTSGVYYWGGYHTMHHSMWIERDGKGNVIKKTEYTDDAVSMDSDAYAQSHAGGHHHHHRDSPNAYEF